MVAVMRLSVWCGSWWRGSWGEDTGTGRTEVSSVTSSHPLQPCPPSPPAINSHALISFPSCHSPLIISSLSLLILSCNTKKHKYCK
ncbi:hypothetical protein E2C01_048776 [Portunus trituberculatus]|uniref:Secreted protein n=1 Tax=Portunus trituberculatus TaxID=210409 RepID=A0A5B7GC35_PORTR|nr:hypothetical protein [Portunus trituberculatus]